MRKAYFVSYEGSDQDKDYAVHVENLESYDVRTADFNISDDQIAQLEALGWAVETLRGTGGDD